MRRMSTGGTPERPRLAARRGASRLNAGGAASDKTKAEHDEILYRGRGAVGSTVIEFGDRRARA